MLSRLVGRADVDCRRSKASPWLSPGTLALCSSDFPLDPHGSSDRPSLSLRSVVNVSQMRPWCRRGDSNSHGLPHYALNVARLPFRHFGAILGLNRFARSRPGDSNPGPAVYETAALPTELGRQARIPRLSQPNLPCAHARFKPAAAEPHYPEGFDFGREAGRVRWLSVW